jgi:putative PIN family toxin of toxin-antitoxin system
VLRVVLDTSVLVSTLLVPDGVPAQILQVWRAKFFALFTSPAILSELARIASLPRIRKRYAVADEDVARLLGLLDEFATHVDGIADVSDAPLRDPKDFIILACVADSGADVLVTSDQDLLVLEAFRGTPIVTPRQFLECYLGPSHPRDPAV